MQAPYNKAVPVAKIIKSFGINGEVIININPSFPEELDSDQPVFIIFDEIPVPFFIDSITPKGSSKFLVKFKGVNNIRYAQEICGSVILFGHTEEQPQEDPHSFFIGYKVKDTHSNNIIGRITDFFDYPGNPCFEVEQIQTTGKNMLLPVHEDIITKTDEKKREIYVNLPKGLEDL